MKSDWCAKEPQFEFVKHFNASKQMFALLLTSPAENAKVNIRAPSSKSVETH